MKQLKFVLVVMNFVLLSVTAMAFYQHVSYRSQNIEDFVQAHKSTALMLLDCYIPGGQFILQSEESRPVELAPLRPLPTE